MVTLFLDFDGVLHADGCPQHLWFCKMPVFELAVDGLSKLQVVISSTWRENHALESLRDRFPPHIARLIVGVTPAFKDLEIVPDRLLGYQREAECIAWMRQHASASCAWTALDDRPWGFRPFTQNLVLCDGRIGLQRHEAQALRSMLISAGAR